MTPKSGRAARRRAAVVGLLALGGALAVLGTGGPAAAATLIQSCPYTIIAPGTYVLARDLTCPGTAITIAADNVRLDLGGNTLTSDGGGGDGVRAEGTGANPTLTGLRVENGTVRGFDPDGVHVEDAPGARIAAVAATGNRDDGVEVRDSPGARVEGGTAAGNSFGIYVTRCAGCLVAGVTATGNGSGIYAVNAPRARFTGNTATGNRGDGVEVQSCDGCTVVGNRAADNEGSGIDLFAETTGARVEGNTATGNGRQGIELSTDSVDGNLVRGNTATGNAGSGIEVDDGATGNRFEANRATGNGEFDLRDDNLPADPCPNAWRGNRFAADNEGDGPGAGCIR